MTWQDVVFTAGGFVFALGLVAALANPGTRVTLKASVPTAVTLLAFAVAQASLGLIGGAITNAVNGLLWAALAVWRKGD